MTDIVKEIREVALVAKMARVMDLMYRAADEVERLRGQVAEFDGFLESFKKQNKALREEVMRLRGISSDSGSTGCAGGPTWLT